MTRYAFHSSSPSPPDFILFASSCRAVIAEFETVLSVPLRLQAQKKRVESILAEEATIDGLENVEVKVFK